MQRTLTQKDLEVLRAIRDYTKRKRVPPTYEEIAKAVGRDKQSVRHPLRKLVEMGLLEKVAGVTHRNLYITEAGLAAAKNGRRRRSQP